MAKRRKQGQSKHDRSVDRRAKSLQGRGWKVRADVRGFKRPKTVRVGRDVARPDIVAKKGGWTRIIEVETPGSMKTDEDQRRVLRRYARRKKNTEYRTGVAR